MAQSAVQRRVLWTVLLINSMIFLGEYSAGIWADSTSLKGDSLDSLGDALVYAISLWVVGRSLRWRAGSALVKGTIQLLFAGTLIAEILWKLVKGAAPIESVMAVAAGVALMANLVCFALLTRFRTQDINMRSVWLCSRNDVIGNLGVLLTTALMTVTHWLWLDYVCGAVLAALFARTGVHVLTAAWPQFRAITARPSENDRESRCMTPSVEPTDSKSNMA